MATEEVSKSVYQCPNCGNNLIPLNVYRRIIATAGECLGAASGAAYLGWSWSFWIPAFGLGIGLPVAVGGTILGGLAGGTAGSVLGSKAGHYLDKYLTEEYKCLGCHKIFKVKESKIIEQGS